MKYLITIFFLFSLFNLTSQDLKTYEIEILFEKGTNTKKRPWLQHKEILD